MPKSRPAPIPRFPGYEVLLEVGVGDAVGTEGGMARVFKARHAASGTPRAIKLLRPEFAAKPSWVHFFYREAELLAACSHQNVLHIYPEEGTRPGECGDSHYHVLEWIEGQTLLDLVRQSNLSETETGRCATMMLAALGAVHSAGILHCDVRPHNFMYETGSGRIVLIDFGIARRMGTPVADLPPAAGGWLFASPEHNAPDRLCPQSDLYSLGIVLYFLLTRNTPFSYRDAGGSTGPHAMLHVHATKPPRDPRLFIPSLSDDMHAILMRLLAKDPKARFAAAAAVCQAIVTGCFSTGKAAPPAGGTRKREPGGGDPQPTFPLPVIIALLLLLLLFLVVGVGLICVSVGGTQRPARRGHPRVTLAHPLRRKAPADMPTGKAIPWELVAVPCPPMPGRETQPEAEGRTEAPAMDKPVATAKAKPAVPAMDKPAATAMDKPAATAKSSGTRKETQVPVAASAPDELFQKLLDQRKYPEARVELMRVEVADAELAVKLQAQLDQRLLEAARAARAPRNTPTLVGPVSASPAQSGAEGVDKRLQVLGEFLNSPGADAKTSRPSRDTGQAHRLQEARMQQRQLMTQLGVARTEGAEETSQAGDSAVTTEAKGADRAAARGTAPTTTQPSAAAVPLESVRNLQNVLSSLLQHTESGAFAVDGVDLADLGMNATWHGAWCRFMAGQEDRLDHRMPAAEYGLWLSVFADANTAALGLPEGPQRRKAWRCFYRWPDVGGKLSECTGADSIPPAFIAKGLLICVPMHCKWLAKPEQQGAVESAVKLVEREWLQVARTDMKSSFVRAVMHIRSRYGPYICGTEIEKRLARISPTMSEKEGSTH